MDFTVGFVFRTLATKMNFVEFRYGQIFHDFRGKKEPKCACHVGDTWHDACIPCG